MANPDMSETTDMLDKRWRSTCKTLLGQDVGPMSEPATAAGCTTSHQGPSLLGWWLLVACFSSLRIVRRNAP